MPELATGSTSEGAYRADVIWTVQPSFTLRAGTYLQHQHQAENLVRYLDTPAGFDTGRREESSTARRGRRPATRGANGRHQPERQSNGGALLSHSRLTSETIASPWIVGALPAWNRLTLRAGVSLNQQHPNIDAVLGSFGRPDVRREYARSADISRRASRVILAPPASDAYDRQERDVLRLEESEQRLVGQQIVLSSIHPFWQNALSGSARGVELTLAAAVPVGLSGWIGYAFGRLRYTDVPRQETFDGDFDQRHTLNTYAEYRLSPRTSVSAKFRMGSNFPLPGYYEMKPAGLFLNTIRNTERVPIYARLDLRANRTFNFSRRRLTLFAEVLNVLNRANYEAAVGSVRSNGQLFGWLDKLFPLLPSAGLRIDF